MIKGKIFILTFMTYASFTMMFESATKPPTPIKPVFGRVILRAYRDDIKDYAILLARDAGTTTWSDFKDATKLLSKTTKTKTWQEYERANEAAARALSSQTNKWMAGIRADDLIRSPFFRDPQTGDIYHLPSTSIIREDMLENLKNQFKDAFVWIPQKDLFAGKDITHPTAGTLQIDPNLKRVFLQLGKQGLKEIGNPKVTLWSELDLPEGIFFYHKEEPLYAFTNFFAPTKLIIDGEPWLTTEHYFQAQKFTLTAPPIATKIKNAPAPSQALSLARDNVEQSRPDWINIRFEVMLDAVRAKFTQNADLQKMLKDDTNDKVLVENTYLSLQGVVSPLAKIKGTKPSSQVDKVWGNGPDQNGENQLGQLLMRIRDELKGKAQPGDWYISYPPAYYTKEPDKAEDVFKLLMQLNELTVQLHALSVLSK